MSGAQTIVLGYTPNGTVLVPPNSPVTVLGGESVDMAALIAGLAGTYAAKPTGTPNGTKFYRDDGAWALPPGAAVAYDTDGVPYLTI